MKPKTMMLLGVAIGCGLIASYMTTRLLAERGSSPPAEPTVRILVAKQTVPAWVPIKEPEKYFDYKDVPESAAPKKAIRELEAVKGQRLMTPLNEEEYVLQDKLLNAEQAGLSAKMPAGSRAIAVKVNAESLAGGFVLPGSYVDIISTLRGGVNESVSKVIMQNMLVLAVDTNAQRDPQQPSMLGSTVTLAAKPEEATRLALASNLGDLRLTLRGMGDNTVVKLGSTRYEDMDKPVRDASNGGSSEVVETVVAPPVPAKLPALPPPPASTVAKKEEAAPAEEAPAQTHTMTIMSGEFVQKAVFVLDPSSKGWNDDAANREGGGTAGPAQRPTPPAPAAPTQEQLDPIQAALQGGGLAGGQGGRSGRRK